MAGFFSDSDEDKAVEELLSQAMDSTVLDQVAAINCSGFTDSDLPSHLETRFRKLKSLPSSSTPNLKPNSLSSSQSFNLPKKIDSANEEKNGEKSDKMPSKCSKKSPKEKNCLSPCKSSDSGSFSPIEKNTQTKMGENEIKSPDSESFSPLKKKPLGKMGKNERKLKSPSFDSSSWEDFSSRSVSPPAKIGCFLCSPKKVSRKKNKENRGLDLGLDEILSDLSNSQKKLVKKAMEEEEKICREAEKIVKWAKHASARMEVSGIEDELSDHENAKFP